MTEEQWNRVCDRFEKYLEAQTLKSPLVFRLGWIQESRRTLHIPLEQAAMYNKIFLEECPEVAAELDELNAKARARKQEQ